MANIATLKKKTEQRTSIRGLTSTAAILVFVLGFMILSVLCGSEIRKHLPTLIMLAIVPLFVLPLELYKAEKNVLREKLKVTKLGESRLPLNKTTKKESRLFFSSAWQNFENALSYCTVKAPDTRPAVWRPVSIDKDRGQMHFELTYTPRGLGRRKCEIYPRTLNLFADLRNKGIRSEVVLTYRANSPMDYRTVGELIGQTNATINGALAEESNKSEAA